MSSIEINRKKWWENQRKYYNLGLILSGIISFILYVILGTKLIWGLITDPEKMINGISEIIKLIQKIF